MYVFFVYSLVFSEISKGWCVKSFRKFPKGRGLNRLRKFTGQGTCSHIHSKGLLGNMRCFWDSVHSYSTLTYTYMSLSAVFLLYSFCYWVFLLSHSAKSYFTKQLILEYLGWYTVQNKKEHMLSKYSLPSLKLTLVELFEISWSVTNKWQYLANIKNI
jgi:hypothetical protein